MFTLLQKFQRLFQALASAIQKNDSSIWTYLCPQIVFFYDSFIPLRYQRRCIFQFEKVWFRKSSSIISYDQIIRKKNNYLFPRGKQFTINLIGQMLIINDSKFRVGSRLQLQPRYFMYLIKILLFYLIMHTIFTKNEEFKRVIPNLYILFLIVPHIYYFILLIHRYGYIHQN